jgi:hypothetical protein
LVPHSSSVSTTPSVVPAAAVAAGSIGPVVDVAAALAAAAAGSGVAVGAGGCVSGTPGAVVGVVAHGATEKVQKTIQEQLAYVVAAALHICSCACRCTQATT